MIVIYKEFKECRTATMFSVFGGISIFMGVTFVPILYLMVKDIGWIRQEVILCGFTLLVFIICGICSLCYAPHHAHKVMTRRITEDLEYGRYIANKYPQHKPLVKSLQPTYSEKDMRPIIDFFNKDKEEQTRPLWLRIWGIGILGAILIYLKFTSN